MEKEKIAIIGTGAAGLACGYFLHEAFDITIYEKNDYKGGHANTVTVEAGGETVHTDTAFVIFNNTAYPMFCRLLDELDVDHMRSPMSFGFQISPIGWEYMTHGLTYCFCDPKYLVNPRFLKMLFHMWRFHRNAPEVLTDAKYQDYSIAEYVKEKGYGDEFLNCFLIPLIAVVWSLPPEKMLDYPARTLVEFLDNHGAFQGVFGQKHWRTVVNGSRSYIDKIVARFEDKVLMNRTVTHVSRNNGALKITDDKGDTRIFDRVILACHADQSLRILDDPTPLEQKILSQFRYIQTKVMLHTDPSVMPKKKKHWAGWNYLVEDNTGPALKASFTYHMNALQKVSRSRDYFVTVNPTARIDPDKVLREFDYEHPIFDLAAIKAQGELHRLNENHHTYFCGSYFKYGFHEDAFRSGLEVCRRITGEPIWE